MSAKLGGFVIAAIVIVFILGIALYFVATYNGFVNLNENVDTQWAKVETVYQERFDLIPRIVQSVTAQTQAEKEILDGIAQARKRYFDAREQGDTDEQIGASEQLDEVFLKVNALSLTENYPNVQFAQAFSEFRDIYSGQENRIRVERNRYNDAVREYNIAVKSFPGNFFAGMFGFESKKMFESNEGAEDAPDLNFET